MPSNRARVESNSVDCDWGNRSEYWLSRSKAPPLLSLRRRDPSPLILCGHGISLRVDRGALLIRDGFTHYPQELSERRIFPGEPTRPTRIIVLDGSGSITFDVMDWLRIQDIALIRIDWRGNATVISGSVGYAASGEAWRKQVALLAHPKRRLAAGRKLIQTKLERSLETLNSVVPESDRRDLALNVITDKVAILRSRKALERADLLGIEGRAAKVYFDAWVGAPIQWRVTKRAPIPDSWRAVGQRQSILTGKKGKNWKACHPLNAMLNYAYAVLEAQVRLDILAHGLDPRGGLLHTGHSATQALVFDLMEPLRPAVDEGVLKLALAATFTGADFILRTDGVVRLNPQLARQVAGVAMEGIGSAGAAVGGAVAEKSYSSRTRPRSGPALRNAIG